MSYTDFQQKINDSPLKVLYGCSCNRKKPIQELYFCPDCVQFVCNGCSKISIDTYFCPCCLTAIFQKIAWDFKLRCGDCVECPNCECVMSIIHSSGKNYYYCEFCKWSSEDIGLVAKDPKGLPGLIRDYENRTAIEAQKHLDSLTEIYQTKSAIARLTGGLSTQTQHTSPGPKRLSISSLTDKGAKVALEMLDSKVRTKNEPKYFLPKENVHNTFEKVDASEAFRIDPTFPRASDAPHLITSSESSFKETKSSDPFAITPNVIFPKRKHINVKLVHRCPKCNKYLVKPAAHAQVIDFEALISAIAYIPKITLTLGGFLKKSRAAPVLLHVRNPSTNKMKVTLSSAQVELERLEQEEQEEKERREREKEELVVGLESRGKEEKDQKAPEEKEKKPDVGRKWRRKKYPKQTARVGLQDAISFSLPPYDDVAEEADTWVFEGKEKDRDKEKNPAVFYRHMSRAGATIRVTPIADKGNVTCSLIATVELEATAKTDPVASPTSTSPPPDTPTSTDHLFFTGPFSFPVHLTLGPISNANVATPPQRISSPPPSSTPVSPQGTGSRLSLSPGLSNTPVTASPISLAQLKAGGSS